MGDGDRCGGGSEALKERFRPVCYDRLLYQLWDIN